jgi:ABC-type glycerol-3-phosphate transport system permease component
MSPLRAVLTHAVLVLVGISMLVPFAWTVSTSLKPAGASRR